MTKRKCKKCHKLLPTIEHYFQRNSGGYLLWTCRTCLRKKQSKRHLKWSTANRTHVCEQRRKWYRINKDRLNKKQHEWIKANREHLRKCRQKWYKENPNYSKRISISTHKRRALKNGNGGSYTSIDIQAKLQKQKGHCYWCKIKFGKYTIDHYVPLSRGGSNWPKNIVLACWPCNLSKGNKLPDEFRTWRRAFK